MTNEQIREVFISNGFTIKPGETDLKPYVYAAARALLEAALKPVEPVAIIQSGDLLALKHNSGHTAWIGRPDYGNPPDGVVKLYTAAPPAQTPPPRLTVKEIRDEVDVEFDWHNGWTVDENSKNRYLNLARAIETAVRKQFGVNDE